MARHGIIFMHSVVISGTGLYQPPHTITNAELVEAFNRYADIQNARYAADIAAGTHGALQHSSVEFIEKASGIRQRYVMEKTGVLDPLRMYPRFEERGDDELSLMAEIAVAAAQEGKTGPDIDMVLCAASKRQRAYPAMAVEIQQALGAGGYGFDMNVACSSATFAIEQAVNAVRCGTAQCVLVVNPEITSSHLEWRDRDCHFIFGDVCTAIIIERAETATSNDAWEVVGTQLATQEGRKVFKEVVPIAVAHIATHLEKLGQTPQQVRRFWLHQANLGMNQLVLKKLVGESTDDRAPLILDEFANTASAGSIIAFHKYRADLAAGDTGVICSFGAGYSVGSVVVRKR